ncbi:hypothetical protein KSZ_28970 [Dictyobacter formicarum]|uniref:Uncharacterized protein n=1 Tax=Dictyobacter formicarum TaxID=2778368 RepID=A0ABQ3VGT8_9CHLR|nr:hypothetical protein KSZ_28970 [Dictyobacter formicarum]
MGFTANDTGSVIIVSYGSVLTSMLPLVLSNIQIDFARTNPLENCSYVVVNVTQPSLWHPIVASVYQRGEGIYVR